MAVAQGRWVAAFVLIGAFGGACGPATELVEPARRRVGHAPRPAPVPEQASYCTRLQPLLDQAVKAAQVGTELVCLDIPGVTELGRFGPSTAAEEDALSNCFDSSEHYATLMSHPEAGFDLTIDDDFVADRSIGGSAGMPALIPWLPSVTAGVGRGERITAHVVIREAHFATLVGVATKLQGQARENACLRALCSSDYTYVNKVLMGTPSVVLSAQDHRRQELTVETGPLGAHFTQEKLAGGAVRVSSSRPVTLAIARSSFRTPQTERLCQFCGKEGQECCSDAPACDGGLGCVANRCVRVGEPEHPCDQGRCSSAASCVAGTCRAECGALLEPCCANQQCSGELRCAPNPKNSVETLVLSQRVTVDAGLFGADEDRGLGRSSCAGLRERSRFAVTKLGEGRGECPQAWWFDPHNSRDCRVGVHFSVSTFGSVECQLDVYATPPPEPDVCLR